MLEVHVRPLTVEDLLMLEEAQEAIARGKVSPLVAFLERIAEVERDGQPIPIRNLQVSELQRVVEQVTAALMPKNSGSG